jgi:branched-chain amino acid transport system ATP-binding protein
MGPHILATTNLTKHFGGFAVVKEVNLRVVRGAIHGVIGPNGAGKTTLFNLLTRFLEPSKGQIFFNDEDVTGVAPAKLVNFGIARSFQISAVFPYMTVRENVRVAVQRRLGLQYRLWHTNHALQTMNDRCDELLDRVGLRRFADARTAELSYGHKRVLEIATTAALEPEMLLLDEPTSGIGREDIDVVAGLIKSLAQNRTVLLVEHNLPVVAVRH